PDTSGRWILGRSHTAWSYGDPNSTLRTETQTYYDGEPFIGMNLGSLDQGNVTRVTVKKEVGSDEVIAAARNRYDDHGNVIETIDPNGVIGGNTHRRVYVMDEDQLRVRQTDIWLEDPDGNPYTLRRETQYEPVFDRVVETTAWMRTEGDTLMSPRRSTFFGYAVFGRLSARVLPGGDTLESPTKS
ncbi:MAG: hypothetical protein AAFS10_28605, partial [Myxococcota bacterium]